MPTIAKRIRRHLENPESHHRRIALGFLLVGLFALLGKLAGTAKEMAIAWRYGVSETVDAYVFVFNLVSLPVSVWFSVLTVVLLPLVAKIRHNNSADLPRFRGELLGVTLLVGSVLGVLSVVALPVLFNTGWAGFSDTALQQALSIAGPLSLLVPMGFAISLFSVWLMANGHHRNTLLEAVPALAILAALFMPHGWVPAPLIWGTVAGFALQLAGLALPLQRIGDLQRPTLGFQSSAWKSFWSSFGIMAVGQTLMAFTGIIDQFFAAHLGVGAISILGYANRIISLIVSLGAMAISRSILPIFANLEGRGKDSENTSLARHWVRLMFVFGLAVLVVSWLLAPWVVKLILERGAFTASNTNDVTEVFRYGLLQLPFYFSGLVLTSILVSQQKYLALTIIGVLNTAIKITFNLLLISHYHINGLMISTALMYVFSYLFLNFVIRKK